MRDAALVVVQAPAGYGKTTGMRAALDGRDDVAWYDAQPWEAGAFAAALIERVRAVRPDVGRVTLALAAESAEPDRLGATFADELRHVDAPLHIVVDDAHVLGPPFAAFARSLAGRMPERVRLTLLTRAPIEVGLPEAVAAGRGALVDTPALRFDAARAQALARARGIAIDAAHIDALLERTEGWPVAIALALQAPLAEALLDELVAGRVATLGEADRGALDATLAYETIEPEIVAPGDRGFAERFAALAADATLVTAIRGGFRVHPLVRELFARRIEPHALAARHAQAAQSYARAGRLQPALFHLDRAHDVTSDVAFLREHAGAAIASGLVDGVRTALGRIRSQREREPALIAFVDGLLAKARGDDARPSFATAAQAASAHGDRRLAFEARLEWIEGDLARGEPVASGRIDDVLERAAAEGDDAVGRAAVRAGWADAVAGRFTDALARLDALAGADPVDLADVEPLAAYAHIALGDFEAGDRAANRLIEAWASTDDLARYAGALVWGARFALLRGETVAAYELAREGERIGRPFTLRAHAAALHVTLAEASLHVADTTLARRAARAALRSAQTAWYARDAARTRAFAARILARADALDGDVDAALAAASAGAAQEAEVDPLALADAAAFASLANAGDARTRREVARAAIAAATPVDGADATALWSAAELLDALDALAGFDVETPLRASVFDGLVARRAEPVRLAGLGLALRGIAAGTHRPDAYRSGLALATAQGPRFETHVLARLAAPLLKESATSARLEPGLLEPLTPREHEILDLLTAGLTNRELAQRLVLSARTVETHVARITGKLGVSSRARAVARAVALGIVAPAAELGGTTVP